MRLSEAFLRGGPQVLVICAVQPRLSAQGVIVPAIPSAAVIRRGRDEYVFVLEADQTLELRFIHTAPAGRGLASVQFGLASGETIVYHPDHLRLDPFPLRVGSQRSAQAHSSAAPSGRRAD